MTLMKRLWAGACTLICTAATALAAQAGAPEALSSADARAYSAAFEASERGDFIDAQMQTVAVRDKSLLGYISFRELMHPSAHTAAFDELAGWLTSFRDLPVADRIFALASRRRPEGALAAPAPLVSLSDGPAAAPTSERGRRAREAYYSGDARRALALAPAAGERWIAGLAAWRLKSYGAAQGYFADLARDEATDAWTQSAAGFWAARAARMQGDSDAAARFLALAARNSETFYGMVAARQIRLNNTQIPKSSTIEGLILASYGLPTASQSDLVAFVERDPRAHRAAALVQIGRTPDAVQELRAGLTLAQTPAEREDWRALMRAIGTDLTDRAHAPRTIDLDYPAPALEPAYGFTVDRALVYAIVRQESRFNPQAVSRAGAVGLMQLMPASAAAATGDDRLKSDRTPLFDPAYNLRAGQDYLTWLMEHGTGYDLLRTVAAYNGGPGAVLKTAQMLGEDDTADSLLLIESLPAQETRNYVEKVMAGYWTYRQMFGQESGTLDAAATERSVDARLDLTQPNSTTRELAAQTLQIGTR